MKEYTIKAIPTMYNGVQFRSRLEATWAAFFDLCGWDWDYEPIDFNGWIPDFVIHGGIDVYVEVKPFTTREEFEYYDVVKKIEDTRIDKDILLLGVRPFGDDNDSNDTSEPSIGWILEYEDHDLFSFSNSYFNGAIFVFNTKYDFVPSSHWMSDREGLLYSKNVHGDNADPLPLWKQAKNITQWNKKH